MGWNPSNTQRFFSETFSPKKYGQVCFVKKGYHDAGLVSITATPPIITTDTHNGEQIPSPLSSKRKMFAGNLCSSFGGTYRKIHDVGMKWRALKSKQDF